MSSHEPTIRELMTPRGVQGLWVSYSRDTGKALRYDVDERSARRFETPDREVRYEAHLRWSDAIRACREPYSGVRRATPERKARLLARLERTQNRLRELVIREPGILLRRAVPRVRHHYLTTDSAFTALRHKAQGTGITGVRCEWNADATDARLWPRRTNPNKTDKGRQ